MQRKSSLFWDITQRRVVLTDVLGQPIGPILKGKEIQEEILLFQDGISFWIS
jgi:hypothetical protein